MAPTKPTRRTFSPAGPIALASDAATEFSQENKNTGAPVRVPTTRVRDNPWQIRTSYEPAAIDAIAESLLAMREALPATSGLQQPPVGRVMRWGDDGDSTPAPGADPSAHGHFIELAFGHSRLRAFRQLDENGNKEYETMPVVLADIVDAEMWQHAVTENARRSDPNPIDEANSILAAVRDFGVTQAEAGAMFGWSPSTTSNKVRLLRLPEYVRQSVIDGRLGERPARALLRLVEAPDVLGEVWKRLTGADEMTGHDAENYVTQAIFALPGVPDHPAQYPALYRTETRFLLFWPEAWVPEETTGIVGACAGCPHRVLFAGDPGPRCARPSCHSRKHIEWMAIRIPAEQGASTPASERASIYAAQAAVEHQMADGDASAMRAADENRIAQATLRAEQAAERAREKRAEIMAWWAERTSAWDRRDVWNTVALWNEMVNNSFRFIRALTDNEPKTLSEMLWDLQTAIAMATECWNDECRTMLPDRERLERLADAIDQELAEPVERTPLGQL